MAACRVLDDHPLSVPRMERGQGGEEIRLRILDGQTRIEDVWTDGTDTVLTRYGVGARGIDLITKKVNSGSETLAYPLYDTHGNMVATLARSGSSYTLGNEQSYDVWGGVRSGSSSEQQGYVANLGHRADPESFLTYMRARYYEPHTGRFISEDRAKHGLNWFVYAANAPTVLVDPNGNWNVWLLLAMIIIAALVAWYWQIQNSPSKYPAPLGAPTVPVVGEVGEAMQMAPTVTRTIIRELQKQQAMKDLIDTTDAYDKGPSDSFDSDDSDWQYGNLWEHDSYIRN